MTFCPKISKKNFFEIFEGGPQILSATTFSLIFKFSF